MFSPKVMLREHLLHNCVPPATFLFDAAEKAIAAVNEGKPDVEVELPEGILYVGSVFVLASTLVKSLHLEGFITVEDF